MSERLVKVWQKDDTYLLYSNSEKINNFKNCNKLYL